MQLVTAMGVSGCKRIRPVACGLWWMMQISVCGCTGTFH